MEKTNNGKKQIFFFEENLQLFESIQNELIKDQLKSAISVTPYTTSPFPKIYDFFLMERRMSLILESV